MEIRKANPDDAAAIALLNSMAWKEAFRNVVSDTYLDTYDGVPDSRRDDLMNLPPDALQIVAVENGDIIGWLSAQPTEDEDCDLTSTYEIRACYVRPDHWRRGVGHHLMNHLLQKLDRRCWNELVLWTPKETEQSHRFYESVGFQKDGKESTIDRHGPVPIIRFRRPLSTESKGLALISRIHHSWNPPNQPSMSNDDT